MNYLKRAIFILISFVFVVSVFGQSPKREKSRKKKPNILFLLIDDLKPVLGCYGNPYVKTPAIDKLAKTGVVFDNAYCQQAVCAPSRISAFTGKRPDRTKIFDLKTKMRDKNPDIVTMPQFFKANGYETVGLGKLMHGARNNDKPSWTIPYKIDEKLCYAKGFTYPADGKYQKKEIKKAAAETKKLELDWKKTKAYLRNRGLFPSSENMNIPDDAYADGAIANAAVQLMEKLSMGDKPFFLALGFHKPHLPFVAPQKYWDMYSRDKIEINPFQKHAENSPKYAYHTWGELRKYSDIPQKGALRDEKQKELIHGYWASVSYVDAQIEKVLDKLKELGLDSNTVVVLWGDHGWHLGDHGLWCKHSNFEQATKVPFIISAPGYSKNKHAPGMAEMIDIFPTLVEYADIELPGYLEGKSLLPVLKKTRKKIKGFAISQYPRGKNIMGYSMRTKRYRITIWLNGDFMNTKVFENPEIEAVELYDYKKDPEEKVSLANDPAYARKTKELKTKLLALLKQQAEKY